MLLFNGTINIILTITLIVTNIYSMCIIKPTRNNFQHLFTLTLKCVTLAAKLSRGVASHLNN